MSTPIIILLILLAIDSVYALRVAYKAKWVKLAIAIAIGVVLDLLIMHLHNG